jgi:dUTP pyrophosphatase
MTKTNLDVHYNTKEGLKPTQGYSNDFAYDMYASEGVLVPPLTFRSVKIPTDLKLAFDPQKAGMHISLRSGAAANTPLIISNAPAVIEGTYRNGVQILVRNSFIDNSLVDFVMDIEGNRVPLQEVPNSVKRAARQFYTDETDLLGYAGTNEEVEKVVYKTVVPRGTVYVRKHERIAQMFFADRYFVNFVEDETLPPSERGEKGLGSSGTKK